MRIIVKGKIIYWKFRNFKAPCSSKKIPRSRFIYIQNHKLKKKFLYRKGSFAAACLTETQASTHITNRYHVCSGQYMWLFDSDASSNYLSRENGNMTVCAYSVSNFKRLVESITDTHNEWKRTRISFEYDQWEQSLYFYLKNKQKKLFCNSLMLTFQNSVQNKNK